MSDYLKITTENITGTCTIIKNKNRECENDQDNDHGNRNEHAHTNDNENLKDLEFKYARDHDLGKK